MNEQIDILIIGGGIAGIGLAAMIADRASCIVLEAEDNLGYHATGRAASIYIEGYGGGTWRTLSTASVEYLARPPLSSLPETLLRDRGILLFCNSDSEALLDKKSVKLLA